MSVVVCNYNGERYLGDLLRSVAAQTVAPAEILVVDNRSTDGSVALLRRDWPAVRVIEMERNEGPCPARNRGMEEARHELVLALDCDLILEPDCLEKCLRVLEADPGLAAVEPRAVDEADRALVQYDGAWFHYVGLLCLRNFYVPAQQADGRGVVPVDAFVSLALLARRERLLQAGGYDQAFFILFEDSDLSYRLRSAGERIACVEDALVVHRGGTAGTSFRQGLYPARRVFLHSRNRWLFLAKSYQKRTLLRGLPGLLLYELVAIAFACAKLAPHAYVHGKLSFLWHLPAALGARRLTSRRRRVADCELIRGGPLTLWPPLTAGPVASTFGRALDALLRGWWRLAGGRSSSSS